MSQQFTHSNEGFATVVIGPAIAHILEELNTQEGKHSFRGTVFPVVKEEKDHRRDKRTDYYLFTINNKLIRIVIEVKTVVPTQLTGDAQTKKHCAQLFLEISYAKDKNFVKHRKSDNILGILTDSMNWHFFLIDVHTPFKIIRYSNLQCPEINVLCSYFQFFMSLITCN